MIGLKKTALREKVLQTVVAITVFVLLYSAMTYWQKPYKFEDIALFLKELASIGALILVFTHIFSAFTKYRQNKKLPVEENSQMTLIEKLANSLYVALIFGALNWVWLDFSPTKLGLMTFFFGFYWFVALHFWGSYRQKAKSKES